MERKVYDCAIIGAGPAGMTAGIYMKSEGLDVIVLERANIVGGQLAWAARVDNLPGFLGYSGREISDSLERSYQKFKGEILFNTCVQSVRPWEDSLFVVHFDAPILDGRQALLTRTVVIATGKSFVRPDWMEESEEFYLSNRFFMPPAYHQMKALIRSDDNIVVIGGGNSAAQYAMELSKEVKRVTLVCRSGLKCSQYLADELVNKDNVDITHGSITRLRGDVAYINDTPYLFSKILYAGESEINGIQTHRGFMPYFKSSDDLMDGLYAIGDVVQDHPNRAAAAIGAGALVATKVHNYLGSAKHPKSCFV